MNHLRSFVCITLAAVALGSCTSFNERVRPLITYQPPPGYRPPVYMTGTRTVEETDPTTVTAEVWRVNSDPYPDSVQLFVRVYDNNGKLITNLAPPYYRGTEDYRTIWRGLTEQIGNDGKPMPIDQFSVREFSDQDGIPYEIALALDYSGTMGSNINVLEGAAGGFVQLKRPQDRIAVIKFDRQPQLVRPLSADAGEIMSTFDGKGLRGYGGYSAIYSAAKMGADQLAAAPAGHPRAVVLFTDGEDNASTIATKDLFEYCRVNSIPVFAIAFGAVNRDVLADIAEYTGGRFYQTYTSDELKSAFEDIYRSLRNYYLVTYKPPYQRGKHIAHLTLNLPHSDRPLGAMATYNTLKGEVFTDTTLDASKLVFFDYNKAELRQEALPIVVAMAELMRDHPRLKIEVQGHTDSRGTEEYNMKLSQSRAEAVRQAIVARGVDSSRIRARGFGFSMPVANNDTDEGRQRNRRTAFVVLAR